jgi:hypothetical protein
MSLNPISRDEMRQRKAVRDEALRAQQVSQFIRQIYNNATQIADSTSETVYRFDARQTNIQHILMANMDEIINSLRTLFPDCLVEYKSVTTVTGNDGKQYDLSTLDEKLRPFINMRSQQTNNSIIIDWT